MGYDLEMVKGLFDNGYQVLVRFKIGSKVDYVAEINDYKGRITCKLFQRLVKGDKQVNREDLKDIAMTHYLTEPIEIIEDYRSK